MAQVQIISGVERRRRWSKDEKQAIVAAAFAPGAVVSDIARQADIGTCLIYRWRQELRATMAGFAEMIVSPSVDTRGRYGAAIEVTIGGNARALIPTATPPDLAAAVVKALVRR